MSAASAAVAAAATPTRAVEIRNFLSMMRPPVVERGEFIPAKAQGKIVWPFLRMRDRNATRGWFQTEVPPAGNSDAWLSTAGPRELALAPRWQSKPGVDGGDGPAMTVCF